MSDIIQITAENFEETINSKRIVLMLFDADWNKHKECRDHFLSLSSPLLETQEDIGYCSLDLSGGWDNKRLADIEKIIKPLNILNVPGVCYFVKGKLCNIVYGEQTHKLKDWLDKQYGYRSIDSD